MIYLINAITIALENASFCTNKAPFHRSHNSLRISCPFVFCFRILFTSLINLFLFRCFSAVDCLPPHTHTHLYAINSSPNVKKKQLALHIPCRGLQKRQSLLLDTIFLLFCSRKEIVTQIGKPKGNALHSITFFSPHPPSLSSFGMHGNSNLFFFVRFNIHNVIVKSIHCFTSKSLCVELGCYEDINLNFFFLCLSCYFQFDSTLLQIRNKFSAVCSGMPYSTSSSTSSSYK